MDYTKGFCMGCMSDIGNETVCPHCGYDNSNADNGQGLPPRTILGSKYIVGRVIETGGEGITYIGKELESDKIVRIREYFPGDFCTRNPDGTVSVKKDFSFSYNESLICFIELAKSLATLNGTPNLLDVTDIFEAGNTAYFVTENISGITLREFLLRNGGQLTWEQTKALFMPLLPVLTELHAANILHLGLSPETLLVGRDGKVRIIGFCIPAARTVRSDVSSRIFPGFAAIEQYGFDAQPGTWTDVYGFAATVYRTLVGNPPPESTDRVNNDNMTIPSKLVEELPKNVLSALAAALQIMPEHRTKTAEEFYENLLNDGTETDDAKPENAKNTFFKQYGVLIIAVSATVLLTVIAIAVGKNWKSIFNSVTGGGLSNLYTSSEYVMNEEDEVAKVIDFKGMTVSQVTEYYEEAGFKNITVEVVSKEYNKDYERGKIYDQVQSVGHEIAADEKLKVYVSLGASTVTLPDFIGDKATYSEARIKLLEMGFLPENIVATGVTKLGEDDERVFEMSPAAGTEVSPETRVEISYYKEIENITVANFVGKNYSEEIKGRKKYSAYQFVIEETYSEVYDKGVVISQSVEPGTNIKNTERVKLTISKGDPPTMENMRGRLKSDAVNVLKKNNIPYTITEIYDNTIEEGRVVKTSPEAGKTITGSVTVYVSRGKQPVSSVPAYVTSSGVSGTQSTVTDSSAASVADSSDTSSLVASENSSNVVSSDTVSDETTSETTSSAVSNTDNGGNVSQNTQARN